MILPARTACSAADSPPSGCGTRGPRPLGGNEVAGMLPRLSRCVDFTPLKIRSADCFVGSTPNTQAAFFDIRAGVRA